MAILTKSYMDVGWAKGVTTEVKASRVVGQTLRIRGIGDMVIYSVYMVTDEAIGSHANTKICCALVAHAQGHAVASGRRLAGVARDYGAALGPGARGSPTRRH